MVLAVWLSSLMLRDLIVCRLALGLVPRFQSLILCEIHSHDNSLTLPQDSLLQNVVSLGPVNLKLLPDQKKFHQTVGGQWPTKKRQKTDQKNKHRYFAVNWYFVVPSDDP